MKKSDLCDICLEKGLVKKDTSEHNLIDCICLTESEYAANSLEEIFRQAAVMNKVDVTVFHQLKASSLTDITIFLLNPTSQGNKKNIRIDFRHPEISYLFKLTQKYVLTAHNLRTRHGLLATNSWRRKIKPSILCKRGRDHRDSARRGRPPPDGKQKKISDFLSQTKSHKVATTKKQRQVMCWDNDPEHESCHYYSVLGTAMCPSILMIQTILLDSERKTKLHRTGVVRHHGFRGLCKNLNFYSTHYELLNNIGVMQVDAFNPEGAEALKDLGTFTFGTTPGSNARNEECPLTIFFTRFFLRVHVTKLEEFEDVCNILLVPEMRPATHRRWGRLSMSEEDWRIYQSGQSCGLSRPVENLQNWASSWLKSTEYSIQYHRDFDNWNDEATNILMSMVEFVSPGSAIYMQQKSGVNLPMTTVRKITRRCPGGHYTHIVDPTTWYQMLAFMNDLSEAEADPNRAEILFNADYVNDVEDRRRKEPVMTNKKLADHFKREAERLRTDLGRTRMTLQTVMAHNRTLMACVADMVEAEDVERSDGRMRNLTWKLVDERTGEVVRSVPDARRRLSGSAGRSQESEDDEEQLPPPRQNTHIRFRDQESGPEDEAEETNCDGHCLEVVDRFANDEITDAAAVAAIDRIHEKIAARKIVQPRRRIKKNTEFLFQISADDPCALKEDKNDSTVSVPSSSSSSGQETPSDLQSPLSTDETPEHLRYEKCLNCLAFPGNRLCRLTCKHNPAKLIHGPFNPLINFDNRLTRKIRTDREPLTPVELKDKDVDNSPNYCQMDEADTKGHPHTAANYRHPDLQAALQLKNRYIKFLEDKLSLSTECRGQRTPIPGHKSRFDKVALVIEAQSTPSTPRKKEDQDDVFRDSEA